MDSNAIVALSITGGIGALLIIISLLMFAGKGSWLIAGYNTMPQSEKARYNVRSLCRFMGVILLVLGVIVPCFAVAAILELAWLSLLLAAVLLGTLVFAVVYANTNNRFKTR